MSSQEKKTPWLKRVIDFVLGLLTIVKWLPFLGKYRAAVIALSTVLGALSGMLGKCATESDRQSKPTPTIEPTPSPTPTPTRSPSPTPTPKPRIIFDRLPRVAQSFSVIYTAPFQYKISLYVDQYRLQYMGKQDKTGYMIAPSIVLNSYGSRRFTLRNEQGDIIAEEIIEVTQ